MTVFKGFLKLFIDTLVTLAPYWCWISTAVWTNCCDFPCAVAFDYLTARSGPGRRYSSAQSYIARWCHRMTLSWTRTETSSKVETRHNCTLTCTQMSPAPLTHSAGAWHDTQRTLSAWHLNAHLFERTLWPFSCCWFTVTFLQTVQNDWTFVQRNT